MSSPWWISPGKPTSLVFTALGYGIISLISSSCMSCLAGIVAVILPCPLQREPAKQRVFYRIRSGKTWRLLLCLIQFLSRTKDSVSLVFRLSLDANRRHGNSRRGGRLCLCGGFVTGCHGTLRYGQGWLPFCAREPESDF